MATAETPTPTDYTHTPGPIGRFLDGDLFQGAIDRTAETINALEPPLLRAGAKGLACWALIGYGIGRITVEVLSTHADEILGSFVTDGIRGISHIDRN